MCKTGYYCPSTTLMLPCPQGRFCPTGTIIPRECNIMSYCPGNTGYQRYYGGVIVCVILDLLLLVIVALAYQNESRRQANLLGGSVKSWWFRRRTSGPVRARSMNTVYVSVQNKNSKILEGYNRAFFTPENQQIPRMCFKFLDLEYSLPNGIRVIDGVSGEIKNGRLTAIMGPSGAGKVVCGGSF